MSEQAVVGDNAHEDCESVEISALNCDLALPPDWAGTLNSLHDYPYNLRYPMGLHGLVLPNAQQTTSELGHLIETVRQTIG
jgi:hypothetical protein